MRRPPSAFAVAAALSLAVGCRDRAGSAAPARAAEGPAPAPAAAAAPPNPAETTGQEQGCRAQAFADTLPGAAASGAVWLPATGEQPASLLVIGDSGTGGAFVRVDAATGAVLESGALPLDDGASDDLEGLSRVGDRIFAITSSGYMRSWRHQSGRFAAVDRAYPIDTPGSGHPAITCADARAINCGANLEGLCLRDPVPADGDSRCAGFVASKERGALYCLRWRGEELRVDRKHAIEVTPGAVLSGCTFTDDGRLLTATNLFAGNAIIEVTGADSASPATRLVDRAGPGFGEAIAAGPGEIVYRLSDTGGAPSAAEKLVCR